MDQLHYPRDPRGFSKGANTDYDREVVARMDGTYVDSYNMRLASGTGADGALSKIGGEVIYYPYVGTGAPTYVCIGTIAVKDKVVEFWANSDTQFSPFVRVNGVIWAQSPNIPYTYNNYLQLDKSEDCDGGLVFDAHSDAIPLVWDLEDMETAFLAGADTYFGGFVAEAHQANLTAPVDRPRFRGLQDVGGGGGVPPGQYYYGIRYASQSGDYSATGPEVGPVMVPITQFDNSPGMPSASLSGAALTDVGNRTRWGVNLRFRINNFANFERIEIVRIQYNKALGIDSPAETYVVFQQAVQPGEVNWLDFTDTNNLIDLIPQDQAQEQRFFILKAGSVRYINYRVVYGNVEVASRDIQLTFTDPDEPCFAFTKNLGPAGHADPINHCYYQRFMSGEKYTPGIQMYDAAAGRTFVTKITDSFQFPTRRTLKQGVSLDRSDAPIWAATKNCQADEVGPTFEVFDHDTAVGKPIDQRMVNVMVDGTRRTAPVAGEVQVPWTDIVSFPPESGTYTDPNGLKTSFLKPLRPVDPTDPDKFGLQYRANTHVRLDRTLDADDAQWVDYDPKVWGVNIHTMGLAVKGITGFPQNIRGFSVVRSRPAYYVQCQAIVTWVLVEAPSEDPNVITNASTPATKQLYRVSIKIPDWEAGVVGQSFIDELIANPQQFRLQLQSPLGFCTEQHGSVNAPKFPNPGVVTEPYDYRALAADQMSVARVLWDTGQINPINSNGGAPQVFGAPGDHYVKHGSWRGVVPPNSPWYQSGSDGDKLISFSQPTVVTEGGYQWLEVTTSEPIYGWAAPLFPGLGYAINPNDPRVQDWHEPFYVAAIVKEGLLPDETQGYITCNHYTMLQSLIGISTGTANEDFILIDENRGDVMGTLPTDYRYSHIILPSGVAQTYVCATGNSFFSVPGNLTTVLTDIANNGFWLSPDGTQVHGIHEMVFIGTEWYVRIGIYGIIPPAGSRIEVWYDPNEPVKAYGDTTVQPAVVPIMHRNAKVDMLLTTAPASWPLGPLGSPAFHNIGANGNTFRTGGAPLPFPAYRYNPRYYVPFGNGFPATNNGGLQVNQAYDGIQDNIRQWVLMFDCECRAPIGLSEFTPSVAKTWPNIHYVPRPYNFDPNASATNNFVFDGIYTEYPGEGDVSTWGYGGYKFRHKLDFDYATTRGFQFFGKQEFGYEEQTDLCVGLLYSERASPLLQNSPGLRTFPANNLYFIEDNTGAIQRLYSTVSQSGYDLFAFTERGICQILVNKSTAYSSDGTSFALTKNDNFIGQEIWRSKHIGMSGDQWRTAAEANTFIGQSLVRQEGIYWKDQGTAWLFAGDKPIDIAKGRYRSALNAIGSNSFIAGVYDTENDEYWCAQNGTVFVYGASPNIQNFTSQYGYGFDQYLCVNGIMLGMRKAETWRLNEGFEMNKAPVSCWVLQPFSMFPMKRIEGARYKADSREKPTRVEIQDENNVLKAWMAEDALKADGTFMGPLYLKKEDGWEQYIPATSFTLDPTQPRIQGRVISIRTMHQLPSPFTVLAVEVQEKKIK